MRWISQKPWKLWPKTFMAHRIIAIVLLLPATLIFVTGFVLQSKEYFTWVQPHTVDLGFKNPELPFQRILEIGKTIPESEIRSWADVHSIDVRPNKGLVRLRSKNRFEIQLNAETGEIVQKGMRRTALFISLHEGTWFGPVIKNSVFLLSSFLFVLLLISGTILLIPHLKPLFTFRKKIRYAKSQ